MLHLLSLLLLLLPILTSSLEVKIVYDRDSIDGDTIDFSAMQLVIESRSVYNPSATKLL